ncbi:MAG: TIR domain-containing protein [Planctomycetota bacterium JB042]
MYQCVLLYSERANPSLIDRVRRIVRSCEYETVDWAHTTGSGTVILREIWESIRGAHRVVAVLNEDEGDGRRPINLNVLYETGYSHALKLNKTVLVCDRIGELPFDLRGIRHVRWSHDEGDDDDRFEREISSSLAIQPEDRIARENREVRAALNGLGPGDVRRQVEARFLLASKAAGALVRNGALREDVEDSVSALEDLASYLREFVDVFATLRVTDRRDPAWRAHRKRLAHQAANSAWRALPRGDRWTPARFRQLPEVLERERDELRVIRSAGSSLSGDARRRRSLAYALGLSLAAAVLVFGAGRVFDLVRDGLPVAQAVDALPNATPAETSSVSGALNKEILFAFLTWLFVVASMPWSADAARTRWKERWIRIGLALAGTAVFAFLRAPVFDTSGVARVARIFVVLLAAHVAIRHAFAARPAVGRDGWRGAFRVAAPWAVGIFVIDAAGYAIEDRIWTWFSDLGIHAVAALDRLEVLVRHIVFLGLVLLAVARGALGPHVRFDEARP